MLQVRALDDPVADLLVGDLGVLDLQLVDAAVDAVVELVRLLLLDLPRLEQLLDEVVLTVQHVLLSLPVLDRLRNLRKQVLEVLHLVLLGHLHLLLALPLDHRQDILPLYDVLEEFVGEAVALLEVGDDVEDVGDPHEQVPPEQPPQQRNPSQPLLDVRPPITQQVGLNELPVIQGLVFLIDGPSDGLFEDDEGLGLAVAFVVGVLVDALEGPKEPEPQLLGELIFLHHKALPPLNPGAPNSILSAHGLLPFQLLPFLHLLLELVLIEVGVVGLLELFEAGDVVLFELLDALLLVQRVLLLPELLNVFFDVFELAGGPQDVPLHQVVGLILLQVLQDLVHLIVDLLQQVVQQLHLQGRRHLRQPQLIHQ
mmetsp:Transcript_23515/g.23179  ORF Transcript_23515/g.23179 Transcript_23515/m.23179 type:complete len:369 (+) Transcript_23515:1379-2485(+)